MECIRCGHPYKEDVGIVFCTNCSLELKGNYCTNDRCDLNNMQDNERIPLLPTDCYCPYCSYETVFFESGFIKPEPYKNNST